MRRHRSGRNGWLRAAVLGANDGILSTASLIVGVAAASTSREAILLSGLAAMVAGATSMAAGEYVSVSSQADAEAADLALEERHLVEDPQAEREELAQIWRQRGLSSDLASTVAQELMDHDALAAHARDELGLAADGRARPVQAAITSGLTFSAGAAQPLLTALLVPERWLLPAVFGATLASLALLGAVGAMLGGASIWRPMVRVLLCGAGAMAVTAMVGRIFDTGVM